MQIEQLKIFCSFAILQNYKYDEYNCIRKYDSGKPFSVFKKSGHGFQKKS